MLPRHPQHTSQSTCKPSCHLMMRTRTKKTYEGIWPEIQAHDQHPVGKKKIPAGHPSLRRFLSSFCTACYVLVRSPSSWKQPRQVPPPAPHTTTSRLAVPREAAATAHRPPLQVLVIKWQSMIWSMKGESEKSRSYGRVRGHGTGHGNMAVRGACDLLIAGSAQPAVSFAECWMSRHSLY
jgi:hypothetical protein